MSNSHIPSRMESSFDHSRKYKHDHVEKVRHSDGSYWYYFVPISNSKNQAGSAPSSPVASSAGSGDNLAGSTGDAPGEIAGEGGISAHDTAISIDEEKYPDPLDDQKIRTATSDDILPTTAMRVQRSNKRIVFWECKIKRISDIDTQSETFRCRCHYYLTWLATRTEKTHWDTFMGVQQKELHEMGYVGTQERWKPEWIPRIELSNAVTVHQHRLTELGYEIKSAISHESIRRSWEATDDEISELLGFDPLKAHWIRAKFECDVELAEEFELQAFPFDVQDFTIFFKCEDTAERCTLLPTPRFSKFCSLDTQFSVLDEWELEKLLVEFRVSSGEQSRSGRQYSLVSVHVKASRKWGTHIGNLVLTFCMFTLGLATFAIDSVDQLGERLGFAVTLMLADVASLQYLAGELPNSPIMTWMDQYMYVTFLFLFGMTAWSGIVGVNGGIKRIDHAARYVALGFWFLVHCVFIGTARSHMIQERQTLDKTDEELATFNAKKRKIRNTGRSFSIKYDHRHVNSQKREHVMVWKSNEHTRSARGENFLGQVTAMPATAVRSVQQALSD